MTGTGAPLLTAEDLRALEELGQSYTWPQGHVLAHEGDLPEAALLIRRGQGKITHGTALLEFAAAGDLLAETAWSRPRTTSITALNEVEVLQVAGSDWLQFLGARPHVMHGLLRVAGDRLERTDRRVAAVRLPVEQRLTRALLDLARSDLASTEAGGVCIRLGQADLAALVDASIDSIKIAIRGLKTSQLVSTGRGATVLHDLAGLRDVAEGHTT